MQWNILNQFLLISVTQVVSDETLATALDSSFRPNKSYKHLSKFWTCLLILLLFQRIALTVHSTFKYLIDMQWMWSIRPVHFWKHYHSKQLSYSEPFWTLFIFLGHTSKNILGSTGTKVNLPLYLSLLKEFILSWPCRKSFHYVPVETVFAATAQKISTVKHEE